ncbi:MAG: kelch repeat-containing protein, partial [Acidimicrobiales bacterium]
MAGFILAGVTAASVAAVPASKAGAVSPATTWTAQSPAASPSARYGATMAYDPATGNMVLFGGEGRSAFLNDTWTWDGSTWTAQSPAASPPARYGASMAY